MKTLILPNFFKYKISHYYYAILVFISILNFFYVPLKVGILCDFIMIFMTVKENILGKYTISIKPFLFFYVFWCFLSFAWIGVYNKVGCIVTAIGYCLLPIFFFTVGRNLSFSEKKVYVRTIMKSIRAMLFISLILYIFTPYFYLDYLVNKTWIPHSDNRLVEKVSASYCMQGFFGATATGFFIAVLFLYDLKQILWHTFSKFNVFLFFMDILFFILNSRKSAIGAALILSIIEFFYYFRDKKKSLYKPAVLLMILIVFFAIGFIVGSSIGVDFSFVVKMLDRFSSTEMTKAFSDRTGTSQNSLQNMTPIMYLFGNGFGGAGHVAGAGMNDIYIYDNNYMMIFCETGIVGVILYFFAIIENIHKLVLHHRFYSFEFYIVIVILLQSVTSNMLENQFVMPLFYFALGCCSRWKDCHTKGELYG